MTKVLKVSLYLLVMGLLIWIIFCGYRTLIAQSRGIVQTDYKDIGTRQWIDRNLRGSIEVLDEQTQTDTLIFDGGNTADTVYMDNKYADMEYTIFLLYRKEIGTQYTDMPYAYPLSDSSFIINSLHVADSSVVQWMTIRK